VKKRAIAVRRLTSTPRAGDLYDSHAHTFEVLRRLGLGVSYDKRQPVLVAMSYARRSASRRKNQ